MRDIYSGARKVSAWLGPDPSGDASQVVAIIKRMAELHQAELNPNTDMFPSNQVLAQLRLPAQESPVWESFNRMVALRYFTRVWIIQEIFLADAFELLWGQATIPGTDFRLAYSWIHYNYLCYCHYGLYPSSSILDITRCSALWVQNKDLMELMNGTLGFESTDKRDRIFALVGLVPKSECDIVVDYKKTEAEVYAEPALHIISKSNKLDVLNFTSLQDAPDVNCPVWVPIWKDYDPGTLLDFKFKATKNRCAVQWKGLGFEVLILRSLHVDSLESV
ncbi:hypothetical protein F53441_11989 [Fusarium austroafricanum]|uniref:Heterokaryon incompatibility domain-containing protein n=1 Tax=Fusarium austroafricanum TaxID=2364996 RepID=A0A8H4NNE4_9HYPO|nr:hypothetical protein F53441_11989 [Fusarium austroafricanum]